MIIERLTGDRVPTAVSMRRSCELPVTAVNQEWLLSIGIVSLLARNRTELNSRISLDELLEEEAVEVEEKVRITEITGGLATSESNESSLR